MLFKPKIYLWYTGSTSITGKELAKYLNISCGRKAPLHSDMIIGWGCKMYHEPDYPSNSIFSKCKYLNNPQRIEVNRDTCYRICR